MEVQPDGSKSETQNNITDKNLDVKKDENAITSNDKNDITFNDTKIESTVIEEKIFENASKDKNGSETNEEIVEDKNLNEISTQEVNVEKKSDETISNQTKEKVSQETLEKSLKEVNENKITSENSNDSIDKPLENASDIKNDSDVNSKCLTDLDSASDSQFKNENKVKDESSLNKNSSFNETEDIKSDKAEENSNKEKSEEMVNEGCQNDVILLKEEIIQQSKPCSSPEIKTIVRETSNDNTPCDKDIALKDESIHTSDDLNDSKDSGTTSGCTTSDETKITKAGNSAGDHSEYESLEEDNLEDDRHEEYGSESEEEIDEEEEEEEEEDGDEEEDEDEDGAISDNREGSGSSSPEVAINEERQAADGQESDKKERKLDHDEDRRDPQYIPKKGMFYEHDDRTADGEEQKKEAPRDTKKGKVWDSKESWTHDLFVESEQIMKSTEEIIEIYGYDIRKDDGPPKARRRRRYVKGPNKYERSWEDEQAYIKAPLRGAFRGGRRPGRGGTFKGGRNSGGQDEAGSASQKEFVYKASDFPLHQPKTSSQQRFTSPTREESWDPQDQKSTSNKSPQPSQQQQQTPPTHNKPVSNRSNKRNLQHSSPDKGKQGNFAGASAGGDTTNNGGKSYSQNNQSHHYQRRNDDRNEENRSTNNTNTMNKGIHPLFQKPQGLPSQRGRGRGKILSGVRPTAHKSGLGSHSDTNSEIKQSKHNSFNNSSSSAQFIHTKSTADEDIATLAQHFSEAVINIDNKNIRIGTNNNNSTPNTNTSQPSAPLKLTQVVQQHQQQIQQQQLQKQHLQKQQQLHQHKQQQQQQQQQQPHHQPHQQLQQPSGNIIGDRYKVDETTTVVDKGAEHQRSKRYSTQRQRALPPIQHGQAASPAGPAQPPQQPPTVNMPPAPPPQHVPPPPTYMHQQPPPPPPPTAYYHAGCVDSEVVAPGPVQPVEVVTFLQPPHALHYVQPQFIQTPTGPIPMQTPPPTGPEMYQGGGITYYNTLSQITQNRPSCGTSRRLKVAIPIVAPPQQDQQQQQASSGNGTNNTHSA